MSEVERDLLRSLDALETAARAMPTANPKPNLLPLFDRIDQLTNSLAKQTDPTLLHYLQKKSYEKARLYLLDRDGENASGSCGHP